MLTKCQHEKWLHCLPDQVCENKAVMTFQEHKEKNLPKDSDGQTSL